MLPVVFILAALLQGLTHFLESEFLDQQCDIPQLGTCGMLLNRTFFFQQLKPLLLQCQLVYQQFNIGRFTFHVVSMGATSCFARCFFVPASMLATDTVLAEIFFSRHSHRARIDGGIGTARIALSLHGRRSAKMRTSSHSMIRSAPRMTR